MMKKQFSKVTKVGKFAGVLAANLYNEAVLYQKKMKKNEDDSDSEPEPEVTEHRFDDFLEELSNLGSYKEYKKLHYRKELSITKKKLLKKVQSIIDEDYIPRITLDEITPESKWNKNITICINGYMSDNAANANWNPVTRARSSDKVFVYHWPSIKTMVEDEESKATGFLASNMKKLWKLVAGETEKFTNAVDLAKKSGKLLAYLICLDFPKKYKNLDLIGFSLGTQVIKSCLSTLKKLNACNIVNNVYFMGGATWLTIDDLEIFDSVNSSITHAYTIHDHTLKLYEFHQIYFGQEDQNSLEEETSQPPNDPEPKTKKTKKKPIGRGKLKSQLCEALETQGLDVLQVDVGDYVGEHLFYWRHLDAILAKMKFGYSCSTEDNEGSEDS